ncbi:MAG: adenylate/guanylate cyclase domain-containing protein, partial [Desulfobacteraceae bacterium]|nr:adenylate/guanylate cyclase domain-containing protein [Desulfobacteraceae bacterium]
KAKLEQAQLNFAMNFAETALTQAQEIENALLENKMHKAYLKAGLLIAIIHETFLDYTIAEKKLHEVIITASRNNYGQAQMMSDVYFVMGSVCYDTNREELALKYFRSSAKIGMLGGVKKNIVRAFNAARLIDKYKAKELLTTDLVYKDAAFTRNRLAKQASPFIISKSKVKLYASTLFVDIAGFSKLMKRSDEKLTVKMVDELVDRLCIVIYKNNGYIDKFLGDGFMAIFEHGENLAPKVALDAIRASVDMNRAINVKNRRFKSEYNFDTDISFRMGMSTGEIYAIFLGNYIKREFTYMGNAVNLASKLESVAKTKALLLDDTTHTLVRDKIISTKRVLKLPSLGKSTVYEFERLRKNNTI